MGTLVALGFSLVIGAGIGLIGFIVSLFTGYITVFDSIALGVVGGMSAHGLLHIHPGLAVLIGIAIFAALLFLQSTRPGFWIVGITLSLVWGFIVSLFAFSMSGESMAWTLIAWGIGTLAALGLHLRARANMNSI